MVNTEREKEIRRLLAWNRFWLGLLVLGCVGVAAGQFLRHVQEDLRTLELQWDTDGGLRLYSSSDGPFIVTHLAAYGTSEAKKATAALPEPIAITDSAGASLKPDALKKLVWRSSITGEKMPAPERTNIVAFYYRPLTTARSHTPP